MEPQFCYQQQPSAHYKSSSQSELYDTRNQRRPSFKSYFYLILIISSNLITTTHAEVPSVALVISQPGLDEVQRGHFVIATSKQNISQIGSYAARSLDKAVSNDEKIEIKLQATDDKEPLMGEIGRVDMANLVKVGGLKLRIKNNLLHVTVTNVTFASEVNVTSTLWPLPISEETVMIDFWLSHVSLTIGAHKDRTFYMRSCEFAKPRIFSTAKNYWLYGQAAKLSAHMLSSNFESYACPQIEEMIVTGNSYLNRTIPLETTVGQPDALPEFLRGIALHYHLSALHMRNGLLALGVTINWHNAKDGQRFERMRNTVAAEDEEHSLQMEISEQNGHHLTMWLHESITNDLLERVDWNFVLLNTAIPVKDEVVPERSRKFLTTMCNHCYFDLFVRNDDTPHILIANETLAFDVSQAIHMDIVNDVQETRSIFMKFNLQVNHFLSHFYNISLTSVARHCDAICRERHTACRCRLVRASDQHQQLRLP